MCRWFAYSGATMNVAHLVFRGSNSIVGQSLESHEGAEPTNGDGFGLGWWTDGSNTPSRFRSVEPAWNDANLREISGQLRTRMLMMHVRAAIGSPVQLTNCHPFRHRDILFMHNGYIPEFADVRRQLLIDLRPELFNHVDGTTDSEVLFHLALGYGLHADPQGALERATGHIERVLREAGHEPGLQLSLCAGNGTDLWAVRYASGDETPRTLYASRDVATIAEQISSHRAELPILSAVAPGSRLIVSEPPSSLEGVWEPIEPGSFVHLRDGEMTTSTFEPTAAPALR
jgi:glutamine amidotransferase